MRNIVWFSLFVAACDPKNDTRVADEPATDSDGDGWAEDGCDGHPDAEEVCDGIDNDCDGDIDEGVTTAFYADGDGDGYGDPEAAAAACAPPDGHVSDGTDCDDTSEAVYPGAVEVCEDGRINDCGGDLSSAFDACGIRGSIDLTEADAKLIGEGNTDVVGRSVSGAGDFNGDGHVDIIVGAYGEASGGSRAGSAYLVFGAVSGSIDLSEADVKLIGEDSHDFAGWSVSGVGDVDGDGLDDVLVGAYGSDAGGDDAGRAYLVLGGASGDIDLSAADSVLSGEDEEDYAGHTVSGAGDVNGDGLDDLLIGAHRAAEVAGRVYLVLGGISGDLNLSEADATLTGEASSSFTGYALSGAGDVDGDGLDDVIVGAHGAPDSGCAYLVLGGASGRLSLADADATLTGGASGDGAGRAVSGVGDVNGDGLDDVLVGAVGNSSGRAYLVLGGVSGHLSLSAADATLTGEASGDNAGWSVSGAGDVNGDGLSDILVGAYGGEDGGESAGNAYLVLGHVSGSVSLSAADAKLIGEDQNDLAGWSVSGPGDTNGDGLDDILIGATGDDDGGSNAGSAYLLHSASY